MPVFDFSDTPVANEHPECTYETFHSTETKASADKPIVVIDNKQKEWAHHALGMFTNPIKRTSFEFEDGDGVTSADILRIDSRFVSLFKWLGENHIKVQLSGANTPDGYAVYRVREVSLGRGTKLSAEDGFLQYMMERLFASTMPEDEPDLDDYEEEGDSMKLTSIQSITDFMTCAGRTLPDNILLWARRNLAVARSSEVSPEERRHAQRALSIMMNIQWKGNYFEAIDPVEARRILDEELYGMESVKQRIIETIIQINRTHTLPAYGLLLCGPAGTGKSQIAYAVARILKLPWTTLDMSSINDAEQLTGSSRIYSNAKPGIIMEAFSQAGESNLVFIINELDKASSKNGNGNPADVLLTLLDNLGFTDNYMECMVPTVGVYPIATANDKSQISAPLMSRFAVIDIPDYTDEEKKVIFQRFALRKVFERMGMKEEECVLGGSGLLVALLAFQHSVSHSASDQLDSADSVVVAGDDVIDLIGIAVGINDSNNGDVQLASFGNSDALLVRVNNEHSLRQGLHVLNAAQVLVQLSHLQLQLNNFLLRQQVESAVFLHGLQLLHTVDALTDGAEVGHHAAQPTSVDIVHAAAGSLVTDGLLSLLLGANKQDLAAVSSNIADKVVSLIEFLYGLLQVNDVDAVALGEDVLCHLGVPAAGLMTEMHAGFEKLFHRYDCHS